MPFGLRPLSYYKCFYVTIALALTDTARNEFLDFEDVGNEELTKIYRPSHQYPRVSAIPEVDLVFRGCSDMAALRNGVKWIP